MCFLLMGRFGSYKLLLKGRFGTYFISPYFSSKIIITQQKMKIIFNFHVFTISSNCKQTVICKQMAAVTWNIFNEFEFGNFYILATNWHCQNGTGQKRTWLTLPFIPPILTSSRVKAKLVLGFFYYYCQIWHSYDHE